MRARRNRQCKKPLPWRHWLRWVIVPDLDQQFLLAQSARRGPWNDCANLPTVIETAAQQTRIGLVLADAEFDSRAESYLHPPAPRSAKRDPRQAREETSVISPIYAG